MKPLNVECKYTLDFGQMLCSLLPPPPPPSIPLPTFPHPSMFAFLCLSFFLSFFLYLFRYLFVFSFLLICILLLHRCLPFLSLSVSFSHLFPSPLPPPLSFHFLPSTYSSLSFLPPFSVFLSLSFTLDVKLINKNHR